MPERVTIRAARVDERRALEALQREASVASGTYRQAMEAHPDAIDLPLEQIEAGRVHVAEVATRFDTAFRMTKRLAE